MPTIAAERNAGVRWCAIVAAASLAGWLGGCGNASQKTETQVAAKVNDSEISVHQINYLLEQQDVRSDSVDVASRKVLDRLIDQELAVQKASGMKLDREPAVLQALEAARRDVLARAYLERVAEAALKPTPDEVEQFYRDKPALFRERRVYQLQEFNIESERDRLQDLAKHLSAAKDVSEFVNYLRTEHIRFTQSNSLRAAEQLPLDRLDEFARMRDGQARLIPVPTGAVVMVMMGSEKQPIALEGARTAIEQFLTSQRKRDLVERDMKDLRAAAKVEYVGKFAEAAASAVPPRSPDVPIAPIASSASAAMPNAALLDQGSGVK